MTDRPIGAATNTTEEKTRKEIIMIKHPLTKNSAKEEPQNCIIIAEGQQQRKNIFHIFIIFLIFDCVSNPMLYIDVG